MHAGVDGSKRPGRDVSLKSQARKPIKLPKPDVGGWPVNHLGARAIVDFVERRGKPEIAASCSFWGFRSLRFGTLASCCWDGSFQELL